jgi:ribosomal protein L11 methyltransferase
MVYYEISIKAPEESREAITNRVMEMGSSGTSERAGDIVAYFEDRGQIEAIIDELRFFREVLSSSGLDPDFSFDYTSLPDRDWNENWKKNFSPIDIGDKLTIVPSWIEKTTARIALVIDPGMVFGTGYHETTRTCLSLIEKYAGLTAKRFFLDVGTGTGVLAIGAAKLGFGKVVAVDTDPMAVDAGIKNAKLNGLDNISVLEGDITAVQGSFDFITANLLSEILIGIASELAVRLNPGGIAVLSGMLPGQDADVLTAFEREGFDIREKIDTGSWVTLVVSKGV